MNLITKIRDAVQFNIIPETSWAISKSSTTPTVQNCERLVFTNTGAVTVTDFLNGSEGQSLIVLGDGNTTIQHGTRIKNASAANLLLAANKAYQYVMYNKVWYGLAAT